MRRRAAPSRGRGFPRSIPTAICAGRARSEAALRRQWQARRRPGRSRACRHHLRRHRARAGDLGGARRAQGDSAFRSAIPARISAMASKPSLSPIWGSPARRSSTASCLRRPAAATSGESPPACPRLSSPASAIGAAKEWRWSSGSIEGETSWQLIGAPRRDKAGRPIVAVTGMGVVTSLGVGKADNWAKLTAGAIRHPRASPAFRPTA